MKQLFLLSLVFFQCYVSFGQQVTNFKNIEELSIDLEYLDSLYPSGIHADTSLAVFKSNPEEYFEAWKSFMQSLGKFLTANDFYWEEITKGFNRIYFNKDGAIDYWVFHIYEDQITQEKEAQFEQLLKQFASEHKFALSADVGFAQCGGAVYQATKKK